jgi:hypothetical protein
VAGRRDKSGASRLFTGPDILAFTFGERKFLLVKKDYPNRAGNNILLNL